MIFGDAGVSALRGTSVERVGYIYPMDFKMDRDGKEVNPRGERVQPTKRQLER